MYLCAYVNPDYPETGISTAVFDISALYQYIDEKTAAAETTAENAANIASTADANATTALDKATDVETRANNGEFNGVSATTLKIQSSRGNIFKNNSTNTLLSVRVDHGDVAIYNRTTLVNEFGNTANLKWSGQAAGEDVFTPISSSDPRITNNGFNFRLSSSDVNEKLTLMCELEV